MVVINLTKAQYNKAMKGRTVQLSHNQLVNGSGDYSLDVDLDKKQTNKIRRAIANGKGIRQMFNSVKSVAKNEGSKLAKKAVARASDYAANKASEYLDDKVNNVDFLDDDTKNAILRMKNKGLSNVKTNALDYANNKIDNLNNGKGFLSTMKKVGKTLAPVGKTIVKAALPTVATMAGNYVGGPVAGQIAGATAQQLTKGLGVRRFKKGSPEAKAHMARIRAMRGSKGKGFVSSLKKAGKAAVNVGKVVAPVILKHGAPIARDMAVNALNNYMASGEGIYKPGFTQSRYRTGIRTQALSKAQEKALQGKVINERDTSNEARVLINGIDTVGNGFSSWGYA